MRRLEVRFTRAPGDEFIVGMLAEERGRIFFEYAPEFLETGLELSPLHLPLGPGLREHKALDFGPLPGLFDDSLPDGWGLLLMDRRLRTLGRNPREIGALDRLAWLGCRTMGALTYHPPSIRDAAADDFFDLHNLCHQSQSILAGDAAEVLPQLFEAGGSPGGARPKVLVGYNPLTGKVVSGTNDLPEGYEHWIVKFWAKTEPLDSGVVEFAYSLMARAAGIEMTATRLFATSAGDRFFGTRRFDRDGNRRFHIHTFGNLIQSNFRIPSADYQDFLKATSILTRNHAEVLKAFRRMIFNVLSRNRDDHVKNFAFRFNDEKGEWSLSPAYDLLASSGPGGEHTMTVAGEGREPGRAHFLKVAEAASIKRKIAIEIIDEVRATTERWKKFRKRAEAGE